MLRLTVSPGVGTGERLAKGGADSLTNSRGESRGGANSSTESRAEPSTEGGADPRIDTLEEPRGGADPSTDVRGVPGTENWVEFCADIWVKFVDIRGLCTEPWRETGIEGEADSCIDPREEP